MSVAPLLHAPEYTIAPGPHRNFKRRVHSTYVKEFHPDQFIRALTLVEDHPVQLVMSWAHLDGENIFNMSRGMGSGFPSSTVPNGFTPSTLFSEAGVRQAAVLYCKLIGLPKEVKEQLRIPVDRWMKSKTQQSYVDKMIDLGIAFESFFLNDLDRVNTFRFSLRGAFYLEQGIEARRRLIGKLRDIYKYRSKAVHKGALPNEVKINGENIPMEQFIERSQDLFKQCLLKVIESGQLPDWSTIELGGGERA